MSQTVSLIKQRKLGQKVAICVVMKLPSGLPYGSGYQLQGVLQTRHSPTANTSTPCQIPNPCVGVIIGEATGILLRITLDKPI